jgi:hypothetical protein
MSERMKRLAGEFLDLSAKVNKDAENGVDVDLEDYFSLQDMGTKLAEAVLEDK